MDLLQSISLGFIQGTTEWLPISSTGHLRIAEHFFNLTVPLLFDVLLHFGTLLVTLIFFRKDIVKVLRALWHRDLHSADGKLIVPIILGSIPTAIIAFLWGDQLDALSSLNMLATGFMVSGIILLASKFSKALFSEKLQDGGKNAGVAEIVAEAIKTELKIFADEEILKAYTENSDFAVFLTEFLSGKPFWLIAQKV